MPIYEYRCHDCGKRSTSLLGSFAATDPPCPHCASVDVSRLVSTFATVRSGSFDAGELPDGDGDEDFGMDDDF